MYKSNIRFAVTALLLLLINHFCWAGNMSANKMSITKTTKTVINKEAYSTIKMTYPVIKNSAYSEALNQEIKRVIDEIVQAFKKNISENQPLKAIPDLPLNGDSNSLDINYKIFISTRNNISIRFSIYTYFYGAAHPFMTFQSLNYDIMQGKVLSLDDIFKSRNYLQFLATYSKNVLAEKLSKAANANTEPDPEGLKPIPENFKIWNITANGLLLTFPPYQVAAYVFGPQEVSIPQSAIKNMLRTDIFN